MHVLFPSFNHLSIPSYLLCDLVDFNMMQELQCLTKHLTTPTLFVYGLSTYDLCEDPDP